MSNLKKLTQNNQSFYYLVILVCLWILFFWRYFTTGPNRIVFPDGDFIQQFFIYRSIAFQQFVTGNLPLWTDCFFAGYPFHADPQAQVFYPPTLINYLILKILGYDSFPLTALTTETILHYLGTSIFCYLFLLKESKSRLGAIVGSITFTYGGYLTGYPPLQTAVLETATWLPLMLLFIRNFIDKPSGFTLAAAIVTFSVSFLAGHPQTFLLISYLSFAYFIYRSIHLKHSFMWTVKWVSVLGLLSILIVSVQLLPQLQFLSLSTRSNMPFEALSSGFVPKDIIQFFVTKFNATDLWHPLYVGITGITFVLIALPLRKDHQSRFWLGAGSLALLLSFGKNMAIYQVAYWVLPAFKLFRNQERAAIIVAMAASVLIALSIASITKPLNKNQQTVLKTTIKVVKVLIPMSILLLLFSIVMSQEDPMNWEHVPSRLILLVLGISLAFLTLSISQNKRFFPIVLIAVSIIELFSANFSTNAHKPFAVYPEMSLLKPISIDASNGRWFRTQDDARMQGHWACAYGLKEWGGISPIRLQNWADFDTFVSEHTRFRLMGIDYLISWKMEPVTREDLLVPAIPIYKSEAPLGPATVYKLPWVAQRAWFVESVNTISSTKDVWKHLSDETFNISTLALTTAPSKPIESSEGSINIIVDKPGHIEIEANNTTRSFVVISEAWYPGWTASIDNTKVPTQLVNGYIQGLYLEAPGPHKIILEYNPAILTRAYKISVLGILLTLFLCLWKPTKYND